MIAASLASRGGDSPSLQTSMMTASLFSRVEWAGKGMGVSNKVLAVVDGRFGAD